LTKEGLSTADKYIAKFPWIESILTLAFEISPWPEVPKAPCSTGYL